MKAKQKNQTEGVPLVWAENTCRKKKTTMWCLDNFVHFIEGRIAKCLLQCSQYET